MTKRPMAAGRSSEQTTERTSGSTILGAPDTTAVEQYLRQLMARRGGEIPLLDELTPELIGTTACTVSIGRAALAHLLDGQPDTIAARLRRELREADALARWRAGLAWCEFEYSWREFRHGREHLVSFAELQRRRLGQECAR
jgi:hypothetical protein